MYLTDMKYLLIFAIVFIGCRNRSDNSNDFYFGNQVDKNSVILHAKDSFKFSNKNEYLGKRINDYKAYQHDTFFREFLKTFNEPDLRELKTVAFRYILFSQFSGQFIFRIEADSLKNIKLTSKRIAFKGQLVAYPNGDTVKSHEVIADTIVFSHTQNISKEDYEKFFNTLFGSIFWSLSDDNSRFSCNTYQWAFESNSNSNSSMYLLHPSYTRVVIANPPSGNFKDAGTQLIGLSSLSKAEKDLIKQ